MARPDLSSGMAANLSRDQKKPSRREMLAAFLDDGDHAEVAQRIVAEVGAAPAPKAEPPLPPAAVAPPTPNQTTTPVIEPTPEPASPLVAVKSVDVLSDKGYTSDGDTYHGGTSNSKTSHHDTYNGNTANGNTFDGQTVERTTETRTTVTPSDVPPSNVQRSDSATYDGHTSDSETANPDTSHSQTFDGQTSQPEMKRPVHIAAQRVSQDVLGLSYNQAAIYEFLIAAASGTVGKTSRRTIAEALKMSIPSIRDAITRLATRGFISDPLPIREASFQGFSYVLNPRLAERFTEAGGLELQNVRIVKVGERQQLDVQRSDVSPSDVQPLKGSSSTVGRTTVGGFDVQPSDSQPSNGQPIHSSSSKDLELLTTMEPQTVGRSDVPPPAQNFILTGPAAFFWEDEGLQEGQARTWCQQFEVEPDQMRQQLAWAQFDLIHNGKEAEVKKDSVSWFFGVLRRTGGCYPRPTNYKTPAEIRAEAITKDLTADKEAAKQIRAAELDQKFQQILEDPTGEEYKALFMQIDDYAKKSKGPMLVSALKGVFLQQQDEIFGS